MRRGKRGGSFWNLRESWASEKKKKNPPQCLVWVKWFEFIPKRPKQSHPQLMHWLLVHSGQRKLALLFHGGRDSYMGSLQLNRVCDWLHATTLLGSHRSQLFLSLASSFSLEVFALRVFQSLPQQGPKLTIGAWPNSQALGSPKSTQKNSYFPYTVQCACFLTSSVRSRDLLIHVDI
jgi:hypothetical protein